MPTPKIATCCYCGTRAALVLGHDRHELTCSSCGAPLHDLKQMPLARAADPVATPARPAPKPVHPRQNRGTPKRPKKKRKSLKRRVFEELIDAVEDIFD